MESQQIHIIASSVCGGPLQMDVSYFRRVKHVRLATYHVAKCLL